MVAGEPWPHPWPPEEHCYSHGHEPMPSDYYTACGECGHVFPTAEELLADYIENEPEPKSATPPRVEEIYFCPHCTHDF